MYYLHCIGTINSDMFKSIQSILIHSVFNFCHTNTFTIDVTSPYKEKSWTFTYRTFASRYIPYLTLFMISKNGVLKNAIFIRNLANILTVLSRQWYSSMQIQSDVFSKWRSIRVAQVYQSDVFTYCLSKQILWNHYWFIVRPCTFEVSTRVSIVFFFPKVMWQKIIL